ncbi:nuclease-like protein [Leucobacter luti]|uniref:Nuclease-like protein n=1 Tax=Leucobacter luti TaxID=340320 RepID=A0A4R6RS48_9MICO|nr:nuclease-related domain-containing protein [Leucobacter luti]TDP89544.1 nuclease-like protein [Leucobacter luti]
MRGQVIGTAGGGLTGDDSWANASRGAQEAGRVAEVQVGNTLSRVAERGPAVLHDLRIPIPGFTANVDHVIVHGSRVIVIDSKAWAAGRYWTFRGRTRIGFRLLAPKRDSKDAVRTLIGQHAPHCDKKTIPTAVSAMKRYLEQQGIDAQFDRPMLAIWQDRQTSFAGYRPQGDPAVVVGKNLGRWMRRKVKPHPADPAIIHALAQLVN